jgi:hypothetical protein
MLVLRRVVPVQKPFVSSGSPFLTLRTCDGALPVIVDAAAEPLATVPIVNEAAGAVGLDGWLANVRLAEADRVRMGWQFPYVSTNATEFPFDFGLALTPAQAQQIPEVNEMINNPPEWLQDWGRQVGAKLQDGLLEGPSFIAFARENGSVYHTYTVTAPDPFVAPYHSFLLKRTPNAESEEPRAWRKDEYPD